ncbi:MAG: hypothetical protein ACF8LK_00760, partial [Phycisphaerales bacterium JB041]
MPSHPAPSPAETPRHARRTGRYGRGESMVWLLGAALVFNIIMIAALFGLVAVEGLRAFWPLPIERVTLRSGDEFLGVPIREEAFEVSAQRRRELLARVEAGEIAPKAIAPDGSPMRRLYRVGNRDLGQEPFRWVEIEDLESAERPDEPVFVERVEWGVFIGVPEAVVVQTVAPAPVDGEGSPVLGAPADEVVVENGTPVRYTRELRSIEVEPHVTRPFVVTRRYVAEGRDATWALLQQLMPEATERREQIRHMRREEIGPNSAAMTRLRQRTVQAEIELLRSETEEGGRAVPVAAWWAAVLTAVGIAVALVVHSRRARAAGLKPRAAGRVVKRAAIVAMAGLLLFVWLERPGGGTMTPARLAEIKANAAERQAELEAEYAEIATRIAAVRAVDDEYRVIIRDPAAGRFAPERQSLPDEPMRISQITRVFAPNTLSAGDRLGLYFARWWEFLADDPREANTEGVVFPVIFGTVLL